MDGRRSEKALNAAFVKSVREQGKPFDGLGPSQRVEPSGPRFQVQRIAIRGKRAELGPGSPALVLLSEAREVALANRKMARAGGGPLQAKRSASAVMTFEEAARGASASRADLAQREAWKGAPRRGFRPS